MHKIPTLKSATARFAMRYPVTEKEYNICESHYLQKISDDFSFGQKKCPKIKPSETFKRPNFQESKIFIVQFETLSSSEALSFLDGTNSSWDTAWHT